MEEHPQARQIIETLRKAGFIAYYAGGWVRDFLLEHPSDDIDIATDAPPEIIQSLFPKTVPIGLAFGIILVLIDGHEYEVATFRQDIEYMDGRRPTRVEFTSAEEDAKRRDFTINGMFYDPIKEEVLDFVGGREDLKKKVIRAIGDPHKRIEEDRLRMIRAVRLSCRFNFPIDPATKAAIFYHAKELFPAVAIERIVQELEKGRAFGKLVPMLLMLHEFGLLQAIFPPLSGVTLEKLREQIAPLNEFPNSAPLIAYLLDLFPHISLSEQLKLIKTLKLPNTDQQFALFLFSGRELEKKKSTELVEWAHFYAHLFSNDVLQIIKAHLRPEDKKSFIGKHEKRISDLATHIERIRTKRPLVTSVDLQGIGIEPGPEMGRLLKEAERISIHESIEDKETVLKILKGDPR